VAKGQVGQSARAQDEKKSLEKKPGDLRSTMNKEPLSTDSRFRRDRGREVQLGADYWLRCYLRRPKGPAKKVQRTRKRSVRVQFLVTVDPLGEEGKKQLKSSRETNRMT